MPEPFASDALRIEAVTCCVGFDDMLDITLGMNHPQVDTFIVVTSHEDRKTQMVAQKHGAICVQTDLFKKNGRNFNKGAAINVGFDRFQYYGWRLHLDSDIILPDNFHRMIFNHQHLDPDHIYGADRIDVVGLDALNKLRNNINTLPQHQHGFLLQACAEGHLSARYVDPLRGYNPIGFFQMWHASSHKRYPYSLGNAAHDDIMFASQWALRHRTHLPSVICYHLCSTKPVLGENWDGKRGQPRFGNDQGNSKG